MVARKEIICRKTARKKGMINSHTVIQELNGRIEDREVGIWMIDGCKIDKNEWMNTKLYKQ